MAVKQPGTARPRMLGHPLVFWLGAAACTAGVLLHLPMYIQARPMHYAMRGMPPDAPMLTGMALIVIGLAATVYAVLPRRSGEIGSAVSRLRVRALDEAPITRRHVLLVLVLMVAVTIDVMKPTALSFVAPGVAAEYGLKSPADPHGGLPVSWLPLCGITGTVLGSWLWGWFGDRIGRRASILVAGMVFTSSSICGAMPEFTWNLAMCFVMGLGAGGMLPIAYALLAETVPARHRGWLMVLIGGDIAVAYVLTSWLSAALTPTFSWRILWLIGLPTGLLLLSLNRWIPESPRFLLATGHHREAQEVLAGYGAAVVDTDEQEATRHDAATRDPGGYLALFRGRLRGPTLAVAVLGIGIGLVTYGFQQWIPTNLRSLGYTAAGSDYVTRNAAVIGLPLTVLCAWMYGKLGSRKTLITVSSLTGAGLLAFPVAGDSLAHHHTLLALLLVVPLAGSSSVVAVVAGYATEIYPTLVRARGAGLTAGMTKAGGVLILALAVAAAQVPSIATTAWIGAVPLLLAAVVFLWVGPETRRRNLEEINDVLMAAEKSASP
ncbi:MFS transporter [Streptomyces sp. NPDC047002]|uniref:MFS transporter n=1 Tax=Streptomyces sp. NPDC047002 TaxID=3155475 RepID=UPI003452530A